MLLPWQQYCFSVYFMQDLFSKFLSWCDEVVKRSKVIWVSRVFQVRPSAYLPNLPFSRESPNFSSNLPGNTYRGLFKIFFINFIIFNVGNIRKAFRWFSESIQTLSKITFFFFLDVSRFLYFGSWQVYNIAGAKFEWHHSNISWDIINFVIYLLTWSTDDFIDF